MPSRNYSLSARIKISLSNISLPWLIFTLIIFSGLVKLGLWQSERAIEKELRLKKMVELEQQSAFSLSQLLALKASNTDPTYINDFPITIEGDFNPDIVFLLDNQTNKSSLGYRAYQVINVDQYKLLVNLGWLQGSINRDNIPDVTPLIGKHRFKGHIRFIEKGLMLTPQKLAAKKSPLRVQQIDLENFSTLIGTQLLPFVVYLDKNEALGFEKNWQPIVMPPEKHRAYAFQWFSLAIAWLLLMIWASYRFGQDAEILEHHNNNKKVESNEQQ